MTTPFVSRALGPVRLFAPFEKVEEQADGTLIVSGVASSEAVDSDGEVVLASAMEEALPGYLKFGAVREMHDKHKAAGTALAAEVRDDKRTYFEAKVVDKDACLKVKESVYKGFSVGGKVTGRNKANPQIIEHMDLIEISLVDRPANPEAVMQLVKIEGASMDPVTAAEPVSPAQPITPAPTSAPPAAIPAPAPAPIATSAAPALESAKAAAPAKTGDSLQKGMYQVSWAAALCDELASLASSTQWESDYERDGSAVPGRLRALVAEFAAILSALVQEECSELIATLPTGAGTVEVIAAAAKPGTLKKAEKFAGIVKAFLAGVKGDAVTKSGAKFSAETKKALQGHADQLEECNKALAKCHEAFGKLGWKEADDVAEAARVGDLQKAQKDLAERDETLEKVSAALKGVIAERDDLQKKLTEAQDKLAERPLRAVPVAVEKAADAAGGAREPEPEPANPHDAILKSQKKPLRAPPGRT